jgi:hypothetical protein
MLLFVQTVLNFGSGISKKYKLMISEKMPGPASRAFENRYLIIGGASCAFFSANFRGGSQIDALGEISF